jgi:predicted dehydrogenase
VALRIGIVGWGEIAQLHARYLREAGARVSGVVSRRKLDLEIPVFETLSDLLPRVDAVTIAVPNHLHAPLCSQALAAGKPVFLEKPLCIDWEQLTLLEKVLQPTAPLLRMGYRLRWNPALKEMRRRLGHIQSVRCIYRLGLDKLARGKDWTKDPLQSGGVWFTLGIHALDLVRWMTHASGEKLRQLRAEIKGDGDEEFPLCVELKGKLPSGIELIAGVDLRGGRSFELDLEINPSEERILRESLPAPWPSDRLSEETEYAAMMADFVKSVREGVSSVNDFPEILQTHRDLMRARDLTDLEKFPRKQIP